MQQNLDVEVFRAGDYGAKGVWGETELDQMAADYDPAVHEAPVTLDHAQQGPALGWVEGLRRVGDRLVARLRGLNLKLLELIRQGSFKKRSIELYPTLRETGRPYVRAVSFLGAGVPEVKGLADPQVEDASAAPLFNEPNEPILAFEEELDPSHLSLETAPDSEDPGAAESTATSQPAEPKNQLPAVSFAEVSGTLRKGGQWHPSWSERGIEQFYGALASAAEVEAQPGQSLSAAEWFTQFLESLPPLVAMGEAAPGNGQPLVFSAPQAGNVDPDSLALHRAVLSFQQAHPGVGYAEALAQCASARTC